jgi:ankyrin repeat protein
MQDRNYLIDPMDSSEMNVSEKLTKYLTDNATLIQNDFRANSALIYALELEYTHIIKLLLQNGEDVNEIGIGGKTPLITAISKKSDPNIIELLLQKGADINMRDDSGKTALNYANDIGSEAHIDLLRGAGAI